MIFDFRIVRVPQYANAVLSIIYWKCNVFIENIWWFYNTNRYTSEWIFIIFRMLCFDVGCDAALYYIIFVFVFFSLFFEINKHIFGCIFVYLIFNTQQNQQYYCTICIFVWLGVWISVFQHSSQTFWLIIFLDLFQFQWFDFQFDDHLKILTIQKIKLHFRNSSTFFLLLLLFQFFMQFYRIIIIISNYFPTNCRKYEKNPTFIIHFCLIVPLCDTIYSLT